MTFADIPQGTRVFVDANPLVYHFAPDPVYGAACRQFLERIEQQEIVAFTTTHIVSDVAHRLMTVEAITRFGWPVVGIAQRLRRHPAEIQQLSEFQAALVGIRNSRIHILHASLDLLVAATNASRQFGLLSGDALIVAVMEANGLTHLASSDADFDRVPGLTRYTPV